MTQYKVGLTGGIGSGKSTVAKILESFGIVIIDADKISVPWFSDGLAADTVKAYTDFISALCKMSREHKRISSTEKEVPNEKYAFRCFLLRLGFIGEIYKTDRKILLKNLNGSSAFKSGAKKEMNSDEISE